MFIYNMIPKFLESLKILIIFFINKTSNNNFNTITKKSLKKFIKLRQEKNWEKFSKLKCDSKKNDYKIKWFYFN